MNKQVHFADVKDHYKYAVLAQDGSTTIISITGKQLKDRGLKEGEAYSRLMSCIAKERQAEQSQGVQS